MRTLILIPLVFILAACSGTSGPREQPLDPTDPLATTRTERSAEELYAEAQRLIARGDYRTAATRLQDLQARYPFGGYFKQAQLDTIYAFYRAREMESTIRASDRFIRLHPQEPEVAYALYMRGRANLSRGDDFLTRTFGIDRRIRDPGPMLEAVNDFNQLIDRFPDSEYADDATSRIQELRNGLAYNELHVARYYMKRQAYVAAANRAMGIIENYQGTPMVADALEILEQAYEELDLADLREDVLRVIEENYPDHPSLRERPWFLPDLGAS
ncbi:outer membrane protein assembly factor BamD [Natronocella acetinitrilica]|uniref:Outer membrane protein assembly factor BamD n=1 Tax=Natronocella acetinitrilica TaxID=414046 RepID=A0AAE3KA13_9GAMM|nr:outer membrane protein assembly factor BamD [Natronocella acetinitrilica]MCP1672919.1 outer membrane protein assembly factor BamD [Natronocella acetinitrilica]